jgi:lipopolysaccharide transport system ATP-binding protein
MIVISVENLSKSYRLGQIGGATLTEDLNRWWARLRKQPDPYLKIGQHDHGNRRGEYIWALKDVNFTVQQGEVLGIIGRNGAGKSTLLKILSRVTAPTSGQVKVKGRIASLLEVGTGFHPDLTGRENIYLNGAILGMSKREVARKFDEIVDFAEIEQFIDTPVKRYSSGMYVRLAFAVAAHLEPEILVVDEVLAVGDAAFQKKCLGKMGDVAKEGRTVLFVSHNMAAIRNLCKYGLLLSSGQLAGCGDISDIATQYLASNDQLRKNVEFLDSLPRQGELGKKIRIKRVVFNDGEVVCHGDALSICVDFEVYQPIFDVAIGIGFSSVEGIRIMSIDSDLSNPQRDLTVCSTGRLLIKVNELFLQPGIYMVDIGARSGIGTPLDYLPGCLQLEIAFGAKTPSQIIRADGGVRMPAYIEWIN